MTRTMVSRTSTRIAATLLVLALTSLSAQAQIRPFFVTGSGRAPDGVSVIPGTVSQHTAAGLSIPVGPYASDSGRFVAVDPPDENLSGTFKGSFTFEEVFRKDDLFCTYGDESNGAEGPGRYYVIDVGGGDVIIAFLAEFNPDRFRSTGKYRRVTGGSLTMLAVTEPIALAEILDDGVSPAFNYSWVGSGWIRFRRGR